jgi:DNA-directed RNA polymerase sigma subunit (sigma70/sigma32)
MKAAKKREIIRRRWCFVLYLRDDARLKYSDIGRVLGVSANRARQIYMRADRWERAGCTP